MEQDNLFDFDEFLGNCIVTGYYGRAEEVVFPSSHEGKPVKEIGANFALNNKRIKKVIIPEGYTSIGIEAFKGCTELTEIKLPESLTDIGQYAFFDCRGLTNIKLPDGLTTIENFAFAGCTGFINIKLPDGLTFIGDYAFNECTNLTNIKLPESLISIGIWAFDDCENLTNLKLPEGLMIIRQSAFQRCTSLTSVKLPKSLTSFFEDAFDFCRNLPEINVDEQNPVFCTVEGVLFDKAMTTLICFPAGKKGKYSVPDGVIKIRLFAFNPHLYTCELTSISLPQSLLLIDSSGFGFNGEQLTDITVSELNPNFYSIDGVLFDKKNKYLLAYPKNKDKTDYAVPDGTTGIADHAFCKCKRLVNIAIPESVKFVGYHAFAECEGLKVITLPINLQYVEERTFEDCPNLETITLSRKTKIGYKALEGFKGQLVYRD
jgi:hypothetical protein